ncbi:MAG: hypothetical protein WKF76_08250 [Nocardioidaceae bacterium]
MKVTATVMAAEGPNFNSGAHRRGGACARSSPCCSSSSASRSSPPARKGLRGRQRRLAITNVILGCFVIAGAAFIYGFAGDLTNLVFRQ